jgi:hypothetical protein
MCDPMTAAAGVGLATSVIGTGMKYRAEGAAAGQRAAQDQQNAQMMDLRAADALQRGAVVAGQIRMQGSQVNAAQRTAYATSGVDQQVGSAAAVQGATGAMAAVDAQTATNNAMREAWGFKTYGAQYRQQADLDRTAGGQAQSGTILGGLGDAANAGSRLYGAFSNDAATKKAAGGY